MSENAIESSTKYEESFIFNYGAISHFFTAHVLFANERIRNWQIKTNFIFEKGCVVDEYELPEIICFKYYKSVKEEHS